MGLLGFGSNSWCVRLVIYSCRNTTTACKRDLLKYLPMPSISSTSSVFLTWPRRGRGSRRFFCEHQDNTLIDALWFTAFCHMKRYVSSTQVDFRIMCENAMIYNKPDTIYHKAARKLLHSGMKILSQVWNWRFFKEKKFTVCSVCWQHEGPSHQCLVRDGEQPVLLRKLKYMADNERNVGRVILKMYSQYKGDTEKYSPVLWSSFAPKM